MHHETGSKTGITHLSRSEGNFDPSLSIPNGLFGHFYFDQVFISVTCVPVNAANLIFKDAQSLMQSGFIPNFKLIKASKCDIPLSESQFVYFYSAHIMQWAVCHKKSYTMFIIIERRNEFRIITHEVNAALIQIYIQNILKTCSEGKLNSVLYKITHITLKKKVYQR